MQLFMFLRAAGDKKIVLLNFSGMPQQFTLTNYDPSGSPENVFTGQHETLKAANQQFVLPPWGYLVYKY